jgi:leucyl-tRNA synthetase
MDGSPDFRDTGIEGMHKFLSRVWALYFEYKNNIVIRPEECQEITVKLHQTIKKVTEDIQNLRYNTAISAIMELVNLLYEKINTQNESKRSQANSCKEWQEALGILPQLLAPFAPHMAEELWVSLLGRELSIHNSTWPKFNPEFVREKEVSLVIQINGKLRGELRLNEAESQDKIKVEELAKALPGVSKWLADSKVEKVIFIPGKLINFVV